VLGKLQTVTVGKPTADSSNIRRQCYLAYNNHNTHAVQLLDTYDTHSANITNIFVCWIYLLNIIVKGSINFTLTSITTTTTYHLPPPPLTAAAAAATTTTTTTITTTTWCYRSTICKPANENYFPWSAVLQNWFSLYLQNLLDANNSVHSHYTVLQQQVWNSRMNYSKFNKVWSKLIAVK